ncbi:MAG TPA: glycosyltransferase family 4 protein [Clostridia bacterium]|jgi:glycosyltransferase involved in cell wall biosynthesis|nr:glycosyltransferase family 4 protein [Clostridia bacterium]
MLTWEYPPRTVGGLARHVAGISQALVDKGVEVEVITTGEDGFGQEIGDFGQVSVHPARPYALPSLNFVSDIQHLNFSFLEQAVKLINSLGRVDLIHAHDWLVAYAARALKHIYQVPLICTIHATEFGRNHGLHNDLQRYISSVEWWLTYEAWKVIVCSESMRGEVQAIFQLPADKIEVINNGINPEEFKVPVKKEFNRAKYALPEEKIVFYIGRLVQEKGVQTLLEAAPQILSLQPNVKFIIAGTGPYEAELKNLAAFLGLGEKVNFLGFIDDEERNALYSYADLSVFPSLYEPFGIVALEGMAAGTPIVVSDTGGLGEIVKHQVNGLKFLTGNPASLAEQVVRALTDGDLREKMVKQAKEEVLNKYSWSSLAEKTKNLYERVLKESRGNSSWLPVWLRKEAEHKRLVRRYDL